MMISKVKGKEQIKVSLDTLGIKYSVFGECLKDLQKHSTLQKKPQIVLILPILNEQKWGSGGLEK